MQLVLEKRAERSTTIALVSPLIAIGLTIVAGHVAMIPISGASFNPARSFGSAVVAGDFHDFWLYVVGPVIGGALAGVLHERVLARSEPAG